MNSGMVLRETANRAAGGEHYLLQIWWSCVSAAFRGASRPVSFFGNLVAYDDAEPRVRRGRTSREDERGAEERAVAPHRDHRYVRGSGFRMYHVHVTTTIDAPQEKVFALLADHERFIRGPGVKCRLVTLGRGDRNGVGAVREVKSAGSTFTEEVIEFDPPKGYAYVVRSLIGPMGVPTPVHHERGWIELSSTGTGTHVVWQSRFTMPVPLVGWLVARVAGSQIKKAFVEFLAQAKGDLERAEAPPA